MHVPELPTLTLRVAPVAGEPGVTRHVVGSSAETVAPRTVRAAAASWVSRACSGFSITDGDELSAASTSARFVIDFDPGNRTRARTGPVACGACQVLIPLTLSKTATAFGGPGFRQ